MNKIGRAVSYAGAFGLGWLVGNGYYVAQADRFRLMQPIAEHLTFAFQKAPFGPQKADEGDHPDLARGADGSMPEEKRAEQDEESRSAATNELELRSLGSRAVNEGITKERYVLHSYLQLTNVSNRTIKIEEWWINRRRGVTLCSKTIEMEDSLSNEAAKLKREAGKDISGLFGRQLRPLQPGEFLTLDVNNDYCGSVFRVDVRTDRQTEFWTVQ
ncbi:hypothetical protein [Bradyrhizobium sp. USDA 4353]